MKKFEGKVEPKTNNAEKEAENTDKFAVNWLKCAARRALGDKIFSLDS